MAKGMGLWTTVANLAAALATLLAAQFGLRRLPLIWHVHAFFGSLFMVPVFKDALTRGITIGAATGIGYVLFQRTVMETLSPTQRKSLLMVWIPLCLVGVLWARSQWPEGAHLLSPF